MTLTRIIPAIAIFAVSCVGDQDRNSEHAPDLPSDTIATTTSRDFAENYNLTSPELSFALPKELNEISGLTALPDGRLGAIQDEAGTLFILNGQTGSIDETYSFGEDADYEGIEYVDGRIFILRSNGRLFEVTGWENSDIQARTHETGLKGKNDTEGLGFDPSSGRLLIACKQEPGSDLDKNIKAIYAYDIETGELSSDPIMRIDEDDVEQRLGGDGKINFRPSAVAVHPLSADVYVLSANDKVLTVLDSDGRIARVSHLDGDMFEQPEGLTFLPDGTLFISSEGVKGSAMLYRFTSHGEE
jgi:uncharacterized protein YjiK